MNLIIVESPKKSKTIKQFLNNKYQVSATMGHIRDLPTKKIGIDIENNFEPEYVIIPRSKKIITELKKQAKNANVILAMDEDREGEAIAWHLSHALKLENPKRIVFHEITKSAIENALKNPRELNLNLVDAQQARRILDRLVGYKLSPLLWKKVARGLSAGRVQSVAVRLIVERQRQIDKFNPEEYWTIDAEFKNSLIAILAKENDKTIPKLGIKTKEQAENIIKDLQGKEYKIKNIEKKEIRRYPLPPFTTSTLQQESSRRLRLSAKQTMMFSQQLYEGVNIKGKQIGLITYMRTDSLSLSNQAVNGLRNEIGKIGKEYLPEKPNFFKTKSKGAQEAHEAIRPTFPDKKPEDIKQYLNKNQFKLYNLIWQRAMACQMTPAIFDSTNVSIQADKYEFKANGNILKFDGFLKLYPIKTEDVLLPKVKENEILDLEKLIPEQHSTKPPAPYSEATLVKALEENGIGRPSTYAPTLDTIQKRNYVIKKLRYLYPTDIGIIVNDLLVEHFPKIVDIDFTAKMELNLDKIAEGKTKWVPVIKEFYIPFEKNLKEKYDEIDKKEITEEESDEICDKCGKPMIIKVGRYGKFLACSGFPDCKNAKPLDNSLDIKCPKCKIGNVVERRTKKGKTFYGCSNYPNCDFAVWDKPLNEFCPNCKSILVNTRGNRIKCSNKECGFIKE
ncbi:type I DNA topoisomerase [Patescibacteria group bacterium]|nr:type I DNA topoisomerase [Patescibacteria group bacterium]